MSLARHEPFPEIARQREADRLGMVVFLASEAMMFGAVVLALLALRVYDSAAFATTSPRLNLLAGSLNTAVLLTSSLLVALGAEAHKADREGIAAWTLATAAVLGLGFLAIKGSEYHSELLEGLLPGAGPQHFASVGARMFMDGYFVATGLHAIHVAIGVALLGGSAWRLTRGWPPSKVGLANIGLYWHFVDIVWVFLFPILYLSR
jgi:cytochrome c oxidase subunit 3